MPSELDDIISGLLREIKKLKDRVAQLETQEKGDFTTVTASKDVRAESGMVAGPGASTYDPPDGAFVALNPNNAAASVALSWASDISRIRYGGSGAGASGPFQIQGPSDAVRLQVDNDGGLRVAKAVYVGVLDTSPDDNTIIIDYDSALTNSNARQMILRHNSSGTPAAGFGGQIHFQLESTTTENRDAASIAGQWFEATDASRKGELVLIARDAGGLRTGLTVRSDGVNGNVFMPGGVNVGGASGAGPGTLFLLNEDTATPTIIARTDNDTDEAVVFRMDKRPAAATPARRWDFLINDSTGVLRLKPGDSNQDFQITSLGGVVQFIVDTSSGNVQATGDITTDGGICAGSGGASIGNGEVVSTSHMRVGDGLWVGGTATAPPGDRVTVQADSALTNQTYCTYDSRHNTSGTPAAGFGSYFLFRAETTTTADQPQVSLESMWIDATHASRRGELRVNTYDTSASPRLVARFGTTGSAPSIGFLGATPIARPSVTGSRGGNAALASLLTALANLGLITDSTSA